jgi:hypothetical protein
VRFFRIAALPLAAKNTFTVIRKRKVRWTGHTLRKEDGEVPKAALLGNPEGAGREEDLRLAGEDWLSNKRAGAGMNYGSWRLIGRSGESS